MTKSCHICKSENIPHYSLFYSSSWGVMCPQCYISGKTEVENINPHQSNGQIFLTKCIGLKNTLIRNRADNAANLVGWPGAFWLNSLFEGNVGKLKWNEIIGNDSSKNETTAHFQPLLLKEISKWQKIYDSKYIPEIEEFKQKLGETKKEKIEALKKMVEKSEKEKEDVKKNV